MRETGEGGVGCGWCRATTRRAREVEWGLVREAKRAGTRCGFVVVGSGSEGDQE